MSSLLLRRRERNGSAVSWVLFFWWITIAAAIGVLTGCSSESSGTSRAEVPPKKIAIPVTVSDAVEKTVPVQLSAIGKVEAFSTVSIRAQVGGELMEVHFQEGQEVKKGDLLFTIDPRPYDAELKKAEANLAKDKAQLQNARKQLDRLSTVVKKGYVSVELYDQASANAEALVATARADEAAVESARLQLKYCTIRSPINGYLGDLKVHQGNVIKAVDTDKALVTINQVSPIYVSFCIPERDLPEVKRHMGSQKLEVAVGFPGGDANAGRGELHFIDNAVDSTTGTILLKGTFKNGDKVLWPGQFVNVVLKLMDRPGAVVVPSQAVQTGQKGQYVYVVNPDLTVDYRTVSAGNAIQNEMVIDKGISGGEKVVIDGQLRLAPGSLIKIVETGEKKSEVLQ